MADSNKRYSGGRINGHFADLAACLLAVALSAWAYSSLPGRDPLRILLVAPVLLFVPGYLLIEAFRTTREPLGRRVPVAAVAPGLSLAFVALLALLTAFFPSGFTPNAIVAMVTLVCVGLLASAAYRRARVLTTDWSTVSKVRMDLNQLPRATPRAPAPAPVPAPVPAAPRPAAIPAAQLARPLQPVRPGLPVVPARQAGQQHVSARAPAHNGSAGSGGDLREQGKQPARTYQRPIQTGRV